MVDKTINENVPFHEIMGEKEAAEMLKEKGLGKENLPKVHADDPQVKRLGAKPGHILKISREDNGNKYEYYRLVVE